MLVTLAEAAALVGTRDPRTVKRNFDDILRYVGSQIRVETADLAKGDAAIEAGMIAQLIGMRRGTPTYSGRNGPRQLAADEGALAYARERAELEARSQAWPA